MPRPLTLADGQLGTTAATVITGADVPGQLVTASFANTGSGKQTVLLTFQRSGGTARRVARAVLEANELLTVSNLPMQPDDTLLGETSTGSTVDYLVFQGDGSGYVQSVRRADGTNKTADVELTVDEGVGLTRDGIVLSGLLEDIRDVLLKIA